MPRTKQRHRPVARPASRTTTTTKSKSSARTTHIRELRQLIDEYCEEHFSSQCQMCGLKQDDSTRAAFHYHHIDPTTKLYNIGEIWTKFKDSKPGNAWKSVERELKKTTFLCAVCHAKIHYLLRKGLQPSATYVLLHTQSNNQPTQQENLT